MTPTLDEIITAYLQASDAGHPLDREELIRRHAIHADPLREFFESEDLVTEQLALPAAELPVCSGDRRSDRELASPVLGEDAADGYTIVRRLGAGGMGVVYEARQQYPHRRVALKVIRAGSHVSDRRIKLFRREAETLARLEHPGIAAIYEASLTTDGHHFFAMEYVDGDRLDVFLAETNLALPDKLHLFERVCQAVDYAHRRNVIHRDLKPSNILVTPGEGRNGSPDEPPRIKILDFGLARITDAEVVAGTLVTEVGRIQGTLQYMSPEQARGETDEMDRRSDVYSLGVILYELVSGVAPYDVRSCRLHEAVRVICEQQPKPPSRLRVEARRRGSMIPPVDLHDLDTIVLKALDKDPAHRFQSARALADDITRLLRNEPIQARRHSAAYRLRKFVIRQKTPIAFSAVVAGLLLSLVVMFSIQSARVAHQRGEVEQVRAAAAILRAEVDAEKATERRAAYRSHIARAQQRWENAEIGPMIRLLNGTRPEPGQADLRGFEWYYLWQLCHGNLATLTGHGAPVLGVAFSPDGKLLVSGDLDANVILWTVGTRQVRDRLIGHAAAVPAVAFSPDGSVLASASRDTTVKLWDVATGTAMATLAGHTAAVEAVAFSDDGTLLASGGLDGTVILWNLATQQPQSVLRGHDDGIRTLDFAAGTDTLASGSWDGTIKLWDLNAGRASQTLAGHKDGIHSVQFSPDGRMLASAGWDHTVRLWALTTGRLRAQLEGHKTLVYAVAFSPDGRTLASAGMDTTVRLWDAHTGEAKAVLKGHLGRVHAVAWSPDGKTLATGSSDRTVKLWNPRLRPGPLTLSTYRGRVCSIAFAPDGKRLIAGFENYDIQVWDPIHGAYLFALQERHDGKVGCVAYSPDGTRFASASSDGTVKLWRATAPSGVVTEEATLVGHTGEVLAVAFSPDAKTLATCGTDRTVRLWSVATKRTEATLTGHKASVIDVAYAPNGRMLASASEDGHVILWNLKTRVALTHWRAHARDMMCIAFSPDGSTLATASDDATAKLWDVPSGAARTTLRGHALGVYALAFSPDGRSLATGSADRTVRLWDAVTGEERATLRGHEHTVWTVAFSPDGRMLASGSEDRTIRVWRAAPVQAGDSTEQHRQPAAAAARKPHRSYRPTVPGVVVPSVSASKPMGSSKPIGNSTIGPRSSGLRSQHAFSGRVGRSKPFAVFT